MYCLVTLSAAILVGVVSGQAMSDICSVADGNYGVYFKPHESQCGLFYQCDPAGRAYLHRCGMGLLFDARSRICNRPEFVTCFNERCTANTPATNFTSFCCDTYINCENGAKAIKYCQPGQTFDEAAQMCLTGVSCVSMYNVNCRRPGSGANAPPTPKCTREPYPLTTCKYREFNVDKSMDYGVRDCAAGTEYRHQDCSCSVFNSSCGLTNAVLNNDNKKPDDCNPSFVMEYPTTRSTPTSYSMKGNNGLRSDNFYSIESMGYTPANTEAVLRKTSQGDDPYFFIYHFAQNMLNGPFGIRISFRADSPQDGYAFTLLGNNIPTRMDCAGTLDITAFYNQGKWSFAVKAMGETEENDVSVTKIGIISQTLAVTQVNDYIVVTIIYDKKNISGYAFEESNYESMVDFGTAFVGEKILSNNCGFMMARGLEGRLKTVKFYEACSNINLFKAQMSA